MPSITISNHYVSRKTCDSPTVLLLRDEVLSGAIGISIHLLLSGAICISIHLLLSGSIQNLGQGHSAPSNTFTITGCMTRGNNSLIKAERCVGFLKRTYK